MSACHTGINHTSIPGFFEGVLGTHFGSLQSEKIIIGSLQVHTRYLTFSLKYIGQPLWFHSKISCKFQVICICC